jgi:hypothetical protein
MKAHPIPPAETGLAWTPVDEMPRHCHQAMPANEKPRSTLRGFCSPAADGRDQLCE